MAESELPCEDERQPSRGIPFEIGDGGQESEYLGAEILCLVDDQEDGQPSFDIEPLDFVVDRSQGLSLGERGRDTELEGNLVAENAIQRAEIAQHRLLEAVGEASGILAAVESREGNNPRRIVEEGVQVRLVTATSSLDQQPGTMHYVGRPKIARVPLLAPTVEASAISRFPTPIIRNEPTANLTEPAPIRNARPWWSRKRVGPYSSLGLKSQAMNRHVSGVKRGEFFTPNGVVAHSLGL